MRKSFNLGIGMVLIIKKENLNKAEDYLNGIKEPYVVLGDLI